MDRRPSGREATDDHPRLRTLRNIVNDPNSILAWSGLTCSAEETRALGRRLARFVEPGTLWSLNGELGAGKTQLVQGLIAGLGADELAISPTYTLLIPYRGRFPLYHGDAYRLQSADEVFELGIEELLDDGGVVFMEWGDRIADWLPPIAARIRLTTRAEQLREIVIETTTHWPIKERRFELS